MNKPKRHHFVPRGYLRGFAASDCNSSNMLWVYDKSNNIRVNPQKKSTKSVAWQGSYYSYEQEDGSDSDRLETHGLQMLDDNFVKLVKSVEKTQGKTISLSEEDKGILAFAISIMFMRTPSIRDGIENGYRGEFESILPDVKSGKHPITGETIQELIKNGKVNIDIEKWVSLGPMIKLAGVLAESMRRKPWLFHVNFSENHFITGDNPVICYSLEQGPASRSSLIK